MVSVKSTVMIGGIIALMLMLQVSCNEISKKKKVDSTPVGGFIKLASTLQISNNDTEHLALLSNGISLTRDSKDFYVSIYENNWEDSETDCISNGFELAFLTTEAELQTLRKSITIMNLAEVDFWIGGCNYNVVKMMCPSKCTEVSVRCLFHRWDLWLQRETKCSYNHRFICQKTN